MYVPFILYSFILSQVVVFPNNFREYLLLFKNPLGKPQYFTRKICALLQRSGCDIGHSIYAKNENGELNIKVNVLIELRKIYDCTYDDFFEGLD